MVFRLNGAAPQTQALDFNGNSIGQAGQAAGSGIRAGLEAVDGIMQQEAELFYQTEMTDFNIGMREDLRRIAETSLGGVDYAKQANAVYDARKSELLGRTGSNPYKASVLNRHFEASDAKMRESFSDGERDLAVEYGINAIGRQTDDAMQVASQSSYAPPIEVDNSTLGLIREAEGFRATPYWDVNAYRTGYGSDTVTRADGTVEKVTKNTRVTREDAERDLARRTAQFEAGAREKVGDEAWGNMNAQQRAVMTSLAYNYGSVPSRVSNVVKAGGDVAAAIRGLAGDNDGINEGRRNREANLFATGHGGGVDQFGVPVYEGEIPNILKNEAIAASREDLFAAIDALPDGITANKRDEMKRDIEASLVQAAVVRMGQENPSAALAVLRSGEYNAQLDYSFDERLTGQLSTQLERQIAQQAKEQSAALKAQSTGAAADLVSWNLGGQQGEMPPSLTTEQYMSLSAAQQAKHDQAQVIGGAVSTVMSLDPANIPDYLASIEPSGEGFAGEQEVYDAAAKAAEGIFKEQREKFVSDAAGLTLSEREALIASGELPDDMQERIVTQQGAYRRGLETDQVGLMRLGGAEVPALDMQNPIGSLIERRDLVQGFADANGVEPILTTPAERLQITSIFDEMPLTDKAMFMTALGETPDLAMQLFSEISDQAPFLGFAGEFMAASTDVDPAMTALRGYQAQLDGVKFTGDTPTVITQQLATTNVSNALRGLPDVQKQVVEFGLNYARGLSTSNGGEIDQEDVGAGIKDALGGDNAVRKLNKAHYILPMGVKAAEFDQWFDGLTDADISRMNFGEMPVDDLGTTIDAEYIQDNGQLLTLGNGVYGVEFDDGTEVLGNGPSGRFLLTWIER